MNVDQPTQPCAITARRLLGEMKEFATREPGKAVAAAFGLGLLINLLPTRAVVGTLTVIGATLIRPVLLTLGATKAMELCCQKTSTQFNS